MSSTAVTDVNLCHVKLSILANRCETTCDTVNQTGSADTTIHRHFRFMQVSAEWVEIHLHMDQHTKKLCETSKSLYRKGSDFIERTSTCEESWTSTTLYQAKEHYSNENNKLTYTK
jgi:hypothetical protein